MVVKFVFLMVLTINILQFEGTLGVLNEAGKEIPVRRGKNPFELRSIRGWTKTGPATCHLLLDIPKNGIQTVLVIIQVFGLSETTSILR